MCFQVSPTTNLPAIKHGVPGNPPFIDAVPSCKPGFTEDFDFSVSTFALKVTKDVS